MALEMERRKFLKAALLEFMSRPFTNRTMPHQQLVNMPNLLCLWDFEGRTPFTSKGKYAYRLKPGQGDVKLIQDGVLSEHAVNLAEGQYLFIPRGDCPGLDIHGKHAQVTVLAWIKRHRKSFDQCEAVAGMWNETDKQRQYCMFLNLRIYESANQIAGHISGVGGPTAGHKYCMDAAIGNKPVAYQEWTFAAITYDGRLIKSYYNGIFDVRPGRNPYLYHEGIYNPGSAGSDFTVGAVHRSNEMGNHFVGQIGGLAVFDRALTAEEINLIHKNIPL